MFIFCHLVFSDHRLVGFLSLPSGFLPKFFIYFDSVFLDVANAVFLLADRFLAEGVIDQKTYDLLARKYPIA